MKIGYINKDIYPQVIVNELHCICHICGHDNSGVLTPKCEHYVIEDREGEE